MKRSSRQALCMVSFVAGMTLAGQAMSAVTPIHWWRMGEAEGGSPGGAAGATLIDSVGGKHLDRTGTPQFGAGGVTGSPVGVQVNNVYGAFNSPGQAKDYYTAAVDVTPTDLNNWGFELWVRLDSVPGDGVDSEASIIHVGNWSHSPGSVYETGRGITVQLLAGNVTVARPGETHTDTGVVAADEVGQWVHYAVVNQEGVASFYRNGVATGSTFILGEFDPGIGVTIGAMVLNGVANAQIARGIHGAIDEVRIFEFDSGAFSANDLLYTAVPEPASLSLIGAGALLLLRRRCRH